VCVCVCVSRARRLITTLKAHSETVERKPQQRSEDEKEFFNDI
jgi:hypothetical protein